MSALSASRLGSIDLHSTPSVELVNVSLIHSSDSLGMTPWQVIEEALARKRPPRGPKWLADELQESIQTVSNWKARGVPVKRYREIANALGLTVDQIEGIEPLPWERFADGSGWPFSEELHRKVVILSDEEIYRLETVMRAHLGMAQKPAPLLGARRQMDTDNQATVEHHSRKEDGAGLPQDIDLLAPSSDGRSEEVSRPKRRTGRRGT